MGQRDDWGARKTKAIRWSCLNYDEHKSVHRWQVSLQASQQGCIQSWNLKTDEAGSQREFCGMLSSV